MRPLAAKGTGDLLSALFAGHMLIGHPAPSSLARAVAAVDAVVAATIAAGSDELRVIGQLGRLANPDAREPSKIA